MTPKLNAMHKLNAKSMAATQQHLIHHDVVSNNGTVYRIQEVREGLITDSHTEYAVWVTLKPKFGSSNGKTLVDTFEDFSQNFRVVNCIEISLLLNSFAKTSIAILTPTFLVYNSIFFETTTSLNLHPKKLTTVPYSENSKVTFYEITKNIQNDCRVFGGLVRAVIKHQGVSFITDQRTANEIANAPI